jgi:hypothetical protein
MTAPDKPVGVMRPGAHNGAGQTAASEELSLRDRLRSLSLRVSTLEAVLRGTWDLAGRCVVPSEEALALHARELRMAPLPLSSLAPLRAIYYLMVFLLGGLYGLTVAELQGVEGPLRWVTLPAVALAFGFASMSVSASWKRAAIARYVERPSDFQKTRGIAVTCTAALLVIDFAASFVLFNSAVQAASLGASEVPPLAVPLLAGLTTFAQGLGAFLGHSFGLHEAVRGSWLSHLRRTRSDELDELVVSTVEIQELNRHLEEIESVPQAHVLRSG